MIKRWTCCAINLACLAFLIYSVSERAWHKNDICDFKLNVEHSQRVVATGRYDVNHSGDYGFCYPPPGVIGLWLFDKLGSKTSLFIWRVAVVFSFFVICRLSFELLEIHRHPLRWLIAVVAWFPSRYFLKYDLRLLNCNLLALAFVVGALYLVQRRQSIGAGVALAVSIAMKLYSGVILFAWWPARQWRAIGAAVTACVFLFIVAPVCVWGVAGAAGIIASWISAVRSTGGINAPFDYPAIVSSLHRALLALLTFRGGEGLTNFVDWNERFVFLLARGGQLAFVIAGAVYFVRKPFVDPIKPGARLLMDATVLSILSLVISPIFQRHHAVVVFIPSLVIASLIFDPRQSLGLRLRLGLVSLGAWLAHDLVCTSHSEALNSIVIWLNIAVLLGTIIGLGRPLRAEPAIVDIGMPNAPRLAA